MSHITWPEIESFHNVRKSVQKYPELLGGNEVVEYRAKVKLHGTNAAVQVRGHRVLAQSRTQIIDKSNDNAGFAAWVEANADRWRATVIPTVFFGEWCGPGIMKGVAVNKIPHKIFAVFAMAEIPVEDETELVVDPTEIEVVLARAAINDVHVLPWYGTSRQIPMLADASCLTVLLDGINRAVAEVEACDPWVKDTFGVEGTGEGLVYYPSPHTPTRKRFSDLVFKAKGEKHKTVAKSAPAQVDPAVAASVDAYAEMVLTEARLEQGARAASGGDLTYEKRLIGPFLAWVSKDVEKETAAEREASGLTWKQVQKVVSDRARGWYVENAEKIT